MARTPSPALQNALNAYQTALDVGLSLAAAQTLARQSVPDWTPSLSASFSRALKIRKAPRPGSSGDRRTALDKAIAARLKLMRGELKTCRELAKAKLAISEDQWSGVTSKIGN